MRGETAFLVWLFSIWTWFKAFFRRRWFKTPPLEQASQGTSRGLEQLRFDELALCSKSPNLSLKILCGLDSDRCTFRVRFLDGKGPERVSGGETMYREFLARIASSVFVCAGHLEIEITPDASCKHIDELVEALLSNTNFRSIELYWNPDSYNNTHTRVPGDEKIGSRSTIRMSECIAHLLLGNNVLQNLQLIFPYKNRTLIGKRAAEPLAKALCKNRELRRLDLSFTRVSDEGMEVLSKPLKENDSALEILEFDVGITDVGLEHVGVMLCTNTSLKTLALSDGYGYTDPLYKRRGEVYQRGFTSLRDALRRNKTLEDLTCTITSSVELELLLEPLTSMNKNTQANTTLTSLAICGKVGGEEGVKVLKRMLLTQTSKLSYLSLRGLVDLTDSNSKAGKHVVAILDAVETNKSLKRISFKGCGGVGGYKVLGALMDLLLHNRYLEDIELTGTALDRSGDAEYVYTALRKRRNIKLWDVVQRMADVRPQAGRVFLCGNGCAGKTTLRNSIKVKLEATLQNEKRDSRLTKWFPKVGRRNLHHDKSKLTRVEGTTNLEISPVLERTRGIEVDKLHCNGLDISIWDMAGQTEYHSFHDLVVPNLSADGSCSLYLVVCNPMDQTSKTRTIIDIKSEIKYWLQFIASNTRRSLKYRPHVSLVITHYDIWDSHGGNLLTRITEVVQELKVEFQEVLEFDSSEIQGKDIFWVDGKNIQHAEEVFDFIKQYLEDLMGRLPKTIKACAEVQHLVAQWNMRLSKQTEHAGTKMQPLMQWKEFCDEFCNDMKDLEDDDKGLAERKKEFVAISLHDGGHIMYHEESKFVITDPHWFCHDVMGEFLHRCSNLDSNSPMVSEYGMIAIDDAQVILLGIILKTSISDSSRAVFMEDHDKMKLVKDILSMMEKLHVCYIVHENTIIVPSTLKDNGDHYVLQWSRSFPSTTLILYSGRRFICKDVMRTMLSPGFFPRLQVSFFNKFEKTNCENSYELFRDVIKFIYDGIEVIIQFSNGHLDILLRFEQSCEEKMLQVLESVIVMHIKELLSSSTLGCPGVILVEHILRPECVEKLIDCKDRKDQFVSMEELELGVITWGFDASHNWKQCAHLERGCDKVETLMGKHAWQKLLQRRLKDLQRYESEIVLATCANKTSLVSPLERESVHRIATGSTLPRFFNRVRDFAIAPVLDELKEIGEKVDVIDRKIGDVLQMQKSILGMQEKLLHKVSSKINDVIAFSIRMEQSKVPKLVYLTETGKRQIFMRFVPGLMVLQLRLMCESQYKIHEVEHQEGFKVEFGTEDTRRLFTVMVWGLNIATILIKIGAHVAGGMGAMVPNFGESIQLAGLILDSPSVLEQINIPEAILEPWPDDVKRSTKITIEEKSKAQQWFIGLMEPMCSKDRNKFHALFKLSRVVYKETQSLAWICDDCVQKQRSKIDIL